MLLFLFYQCGVGDGDDHDDEGDPVSGISSHWRKYGWNGCEQEWDGTMIIESAVSDAYLARVQGMARTHKGEW